MKNIMAWLAIGYALTAWGMTAAPKSGFPGPQPPSLAESGAALESPGPDQGRPFPDRGRRWEIIRKYRTRPETLPPGNLPQPHYGVTPIVALAFPLTFVIAVAAVVVVSIWAAHRTRMSRYQLIQTALAQGQAIPPAILADARGHGDPLGAGLILIGVGVGLAVALGVTATPTHATWGLIPLLIGVAMLVSIPLRKRIDRKQDDT